MTLVSVTAYHSFGGEVEASNTPTIRRLTPSCRHQLPRIAPSDFPVGKSEGVVAAYEALQAVFSSACLGGALNPKMINAASQPLIRHIEREGLASWINTVRKHHSQTYQHSLLVTGTAVAFGQHLGL